MMYTMAFANSSVYMQLYLITEIFSDLTNFSPLS
ncbi:MAG: hypothetical protein BWX95_00450 [Bacteroidetes bacterium ADurb.Bin141]|nr:MAG: hypothetical protein BWX95_00450 [Bacteroidetes bacterium ADurb.Bin141]